MTCTASPILIGCVAHLLIYTSVYTCSFTAPDDSFRASWQQVYSCILFLNRRSVQLVEPPLHLLPNKSEQHLSAPAPSAIRAGLAAPRHARRAARRASAPRGCARPGGVEDVRFKATWNPTDPCFDRTLGHMLGRWWSKIEVIQVQVVHSKEVGLG